jgi:hypothetical protein
MKRLVALLPVLIAFQAGAPPALAWTWPVDGPVLRPFVLGDDPYAAGQHRGIDIAAERGSPVRAPAAGTVSFAGTVPGGGRTVTLRTEDGYAVTLVHLGGIAVTPGAPVAEGATVGTIGPSGEAEHAKPYVQFGVRVADDPNGYLDPLAFLPVREVTPPLIPDSADDPESPQEPAPAPAPVTSPAPGPAEAPAPTAPVAPPGASDEPVVVPAAAAASGRSARSAAQAAPAGVEDERTDEHIVSEQGRASRREGPPPAEGGALPRLPRHTKQRFFEHLALAPESGASPAAARSSKRVHEGAGEDFPRLSLGTAALAGVLAALVALAAALTRLRRGQLSHARPAHAAAPVLVNAAGGAAEDTRRSRTAEDDRLVPHRDLEWIPLREAEALADLDRDDDATQLVEVPNDARRRLATTVVANPRAHRARGHQPSRCRRSERLVAR